MGREGARAFLASRLQARSPDAGGASRLRAACRGSHCHRPFSLRLVEPLLRARCWQGVAACAWAPPHHFADHRHAGGVLAHWLRQHVRLWWPQWLLLLVVVVAAARSEQKQKCWTWVGEWWQWRHMEQPVWRGHLAATGERVCHLLCCRCCLCCDWCAAAVARGSWAGPSMLPVTMRGTRQRASGTYARCPAPMQGEAWSARGAEDQWRRAGMPRPFCGSGTQAPYQRTRL